MMDRDRPRGLSASKPAQNCEDSRVLCAASCARPFAALIFHCHMIQQSKRVVVIADSSKVSEQELQKVVKAGMRKVTTAITRPLLRKIAISIR